MFIKILLVADWLLFSNRVCHFFCLFIGRASSNSDGGVASFQFPCDLQKTTKMSVYLDLFDRKSKHIKKEMCDCAARVPTGVG